MNDDLRKRAEQYYDEHLAKIASVGHGSGSVSGPGLVGGGSVGSLFPPSPNLDLEPNKNHHEKRKGVINKLFGKEDPREVATVAVIDRNNHRILMGKRKDNGKWTNPGGHIDYGETRDAGALRELKEEAGIDGQEVKYVKSYPIEDRNLIVHAYVCHILGGCETSPKGDPDEEVGEWQWLDYSKGLPKEVLDNLHANRNVVLEMMGLEKTDDYIPNTGLKAGNGKPYVDNFDKSEIREKLLLLKGLLR